jgi:hypothetical protein
MTYSFTQISQCLCCPRKYRYRYLDGWREKEDRASMIFGRCFENALAAYFRGGDSTATFFKAWQEHQARSTVCEERLLGPALSPGCSPARTIRPGRSCADPLPEEKSPGQVPALTSVRKRICVLRGCNWRAGWDEMHPRLENDRIALSGTARWSLVARPAARLLLLDDRNRGCLPGGVRSQKRARNSVSEDVHR